MNKYSLVLQILAIIVILVLIYFFIKYLISLKKLNRLSYYSIDNNKNDSFIINIVKLFGDFLEVLVVFNGIAKSYDKYLSDDNKINKGIYCISIKILLGLFLIIINIFGCFLLKDNINGLLILLSFVIGFVTPDYYFLLYRSRRAKILNRNILGAIIIMNNSYKISGSTELALKDVISRTDGVVKEEFSRVLNDIKLGLDISDAFLRMYIRTKLKVVLYISRFLSLTTKFGINITEAFDNIEKKLLDNERLNNELNNIHNINAISGLLFALLPLIFIFILVVYNRVYLDLFLSNMGVFVVSILLLLYLLYLIFIRTIMRGGKYDK